MLVSGDASCIVEVSIPNKHHLTLNVQRTTQLINKKKFTPEVDGKKEKFTVLSLSNHSHMSFYFQVH